MISDNFAAKTKLIAELESMMNVKMEAAILPTATHDAGLMNVSISSLPRLVRRLLDELEIDEKARLDGDYVQNLSFAFDVKCFLGTILAVLSRDGVVEGGTGAIRK